LGGPLHTQDAGNNEATEMARTDIVRPSKLWGLTSRDWTTRDHIARVDIMRPDNVAPDQTEVYNFYAAWNIRPI